MDFLVYLVNLVFFVYLVYLVFLVSLVFLPTACCLLLTILFTPAFFLLCSSALLHLCVTPIRSLRVPELSTYGQ